MSIEIRGGNMIVGRSAATKKVIRLSTLNDMELTARELALRYNTSMSQIFKWRAAARQVLKSEDVSQETPAPHICTPNCV